MKKRDPYLTSSYDFELDSSFIATQPASPKDSAKLLVYNRQANTITHSTFKNIQDFLPKDVSILFNNTKVIKHNFNIYFMKPDTARRIAS